MLYSRPPRARSDTDSGSFHRHGRCGSRPPRAAHAASRGRLFDTESARPRRGCRGARGLPRPAGVGPIPRRSALKQRCDGAVNAGGRRVIRGSSRTANLRPSKPSQLRSTLRSRGRIPGKRRASIVLPDPGTRLRGGCDRPPDVGPGRDRSPRPRIEIGWIGPFIDPPRRTAKLQSCRRDQSSRRNRRSPLHRCGECLAQHSNLRTAHNPSVLGRVDPCRVPHVSTRDLDLAACVGMSVGHVCPRVSNVQPR